VTEVSYVGEKIDFALLACCAASLILLPLFVIGVVLALFAVAVAGEIADLGGGRARTIAPGNCHGH